MRKYTTFVVGNSITCVISCNYRVVATLYTVETWCVAGVLCVMVINVDDDNYVNNNKNFTQNSRGLR